MGSRRFLLRIERRSRFNRRRGGGLLQGHYAMNSIIETARMRLRGWTDSDFEPWSRLFADPIVMEFFPQTYGPEESIPEAQHAREEFERNGYGWFIAEVK